MKSVRIEGRDEQRVEMGKGGERKKKLKYSNHRCEHNIKYIYIYIYFTFELQHIAIFGYAL